MPLNWKMSFSGSLLQKILLSFISLYLINVLVENRKKATTSGDKKSILYRRQKHSYY